MITKILSLLAGFRPQLNINVNEDDAPDIPPGTSWIDKLAFHLGIFLLVILAYELSRDAIPTGIGIKAINNWPSKRNNQRIAD